MTKKDFLLPLGERNVTPENTDELYKSKISERKRKEIQRQEEEDDARHEAKMAELKKKTKTSDADSEKAERKAEAPEPAFKFTGGVNLGTIDLQQQQKDAADKLEKLRLEAENTAGRTAQENQLLREKINEQQITFLQSTFQMQMEQINKTIESSASRKTFIEQYTEAMETAKTLGLAQPSGQSTDLQTTVAIKKLDFDQAIALRTFAREEKRADREFQRQLNKDDDERNAEKAKLELEKTKRSELADSLKNAAKVLGQGIAMGGGEESPSASSQPPRGQKMPVIEAGVGDSGVLECTVCKQPVAIGPTAKTAVCAGCDARYPIKREGLAQAPVEPVAEEEE